MRRFLFFFFFSGRWLVRPGSPTGGAGPVEGRERLRERLEATHHRPGRLTYGIVTALEDGHQWLDRNLGATQVATNKDGLSRIRLSLPMGPGCGRASAHHTHQRNLGNGGLWEHKRTESYGHGGQPVVHHKQRVSV